MGVLKSIDPEHLFDNLHLVCYDDGDRKHRDDGSWTIDLQLTGGELCRSIALTLLSHHWQILWRPSGYTKATLCGMGRTAVYRMVRWNWSSTFVKTSSGCTTGRIMNGPRAFAAA